MMLFFITVNIASMNRKLTMTIVAEDKELEDLRTIRKEIQDTKKEEGEELELLNKIREELRGLLKQGGHGGQRGLGSQSNQNNRVSPGDIMLNKLKDVENEIKEKHQTRREKIEKDWEICPKCNIPMVAYFKYNRKTGEYNKNLGALYICPKCDYHKLKKIDEKLFRSKHHYLPLSKEKRPEWMKEDMKGLSNSKIFSEKRKGM